MNNRIRWSPLFLVLLTSCNSVAEASPTGVPNLSGIATVSTGGHERNIPVDAGAFMPDSSSIADSCAALARSGTGSGGAIALAFGSEVMAPKTTDKATIIGLEVEAYHGPGAYEVSGKNVIVDGTPYTPTSGSVKFEADGSGVAEISAKADGGKRIRIRLAYVCAA